MYTEEQEYSANLDPESALRTSTIQAIAMIELMLRRWNEPPNTERLHLTAFMHQVMALIYQYGGITAKQAWDGLVQSGIFKGIDKTMFVHLLKRMGNPDVGLLEQAPDGTLLLGREGERITSSFDFYAVFETYDEYRVVCRGKEIGHLPMAMPYQEGHLLIFGGKYWKILEIDVQRREILVERGKGGKAPSFMSESGPQSDVVVAEMRRVYEEVAIPRYLDQTAIDLLHQSRKSFVSYGLSQRHIMEHGDGFLLFPWLGSLGRVTLQLALGSHGLRVGFPGGITVKVAQCEKKELIKALDGIVNAPPVRAEQLAIQVPKKTIDKFDAYLDEELQAQNFGKARLDTSKLQQTAMLLLNEIKQ